MTTVRVLSGSYGEWNEGDIVTDAPLGLVNIANAGVKNAATGKRVAEIVVEEQKPDHSAQELKELKAKAKELKVEGYGKMTADALKEAIAAAEKAIADAEEELKQLQAKAAELKVVDFEKMNRDELVTAIEAAGGGKGDE